MPLSRFIYSVPIRVVTLVAFASSLGCERPLVRTDAPLFLQPDVAGTSPTRVENGLALTASPLGSHASLLVVKLPPKTQTLEGTVLRFFGALAQGKIAALLPLFAPSAILTDSRGTPIDLVAHWTRRLERFDYRITTYDSPLWVPDIVILSQDDDRAKSVVAVLKPKPEDQLIWVPISKSRYDGQQLFGNELWFLLRQDDTGFRIVACMEDLD